jgi:hypothetical protein
VSDPRHLRAREVFLGACERPQDKRQRYLDHECGDDGALHQEVEKLLERHNEAVRISAAAKEDTANRFLSARLMNNPGVDSGRIEISARRRAASLASMTSHDHRLRLIFTLLLLLLFLMGVQRITFRAVERSLENLASETLSALLTADVTAIQVWADSEKRSLETHASMPGVRHHAARLIWAAGAESDAHGSNADEALLALLAPLAQRADSFGYAIADRAGNILLSVTPKMPDKLADRVSPQVFSLMAEALDGKTVVSTPQPANRLDPSISLGVPVILVATPLRAPESSEIIGVLGRITNPNTDFSRILSVAKLSNSGETIAFDSEGVLLSKSRFDDRLKDLGLVDFAERRETGVTMTLRDPGIALRQGHLLDAPLAAQPLIKMVANAVAGYEGIDLEGHRDYRGVEVLAAWRWIEELGIGVATKIDRQEVHAVLRPLRWAFRLLFLLGAAATIGSGALYWQTRRLSSRIENIRQLGQYKLDKKIGEGGMGIVYRARHAMLRRPTAIKLLKPEGFSDDGIARFEREVQVTSTLTHPNTVQIYDYGRTPQGWFYYAMEYIDGYTLDAILESDGPMPPSRAVHTLKQVCGSLAEAHGRGIFGLVKDLDLMPGDPNATSSLGIRGTPLYIAPERFRDPAINTPQTDIYAVGVLAYNLLAGKQPFAGANLLEQILSAPPIPFAQRVPDLDCKQLEDLIMGCLSKEPSDRPASAQAMLEALEDLEGIPLWTREDAKRWWETH